MKMQTTIQLGFALIVLFAVSSIVRAADPIPLGIVEKQLQTAIESGNGPLAAQWAAVRRDIVLGDVYVPLAQLVRENRPVLDAFVKMSPMFLSEAGKLAADKGKAEGFSEDGLLLTFWGRVLEGKATGKDVTKLFDDLGKVEKFSEVAVPPEEGEVTEDAVVVEEEIVAPVEEITAPATPATPVVTAAKPAASTHKELRMKRLDKRMARLQHADTD